jgi:hypothetical protein
MWSTPQTGSLSDWGTWVTIPGTDIQIRQTSTVGSGRFQIRIRPEGAYDQCITDDPAVISEWVTEDAHGDLLDPGSPRFTAPTSGMYEVGPAGNLRPASER